MGDKDIHSSHRVCSPWDQCCFLQWNLSYRVKESAGKLERKRKVCVWGGGGEGGGEGRAGGGGACCSKTTSLANTHGTQRQRGAGGGGGGARGQTQT